MSEKTNTTGRAIGTVAALVALAAAAPVEGAVIISPTSEVTVVAGSGGPDSTTLEVDLDGDSLVDFFFVSGLQGSFITGRTADEQIIVDDFSMIRLFNSGETISSDLLGSQFPSIDDTDMDFVGFRFSNAQGSHMGVMTLSSVNDTSITIHTIQWESVAGAGIIATSVPEPGCVMLVASFGALAMTRRRRERTGS